MVQLFWRPKSSLAGFRQRFPVVAVLLLGGLALSIILAWRSGQLRQDQFKLFISFTIVDVALFIFLREVDRMKVALITFLFSLEVLMIAYYSFTLWSAHLSR